MILLKYKLLTQLVKASFASTGQEFIDLSYRSPFNTRRVHISLDANRLV